MAQLPNAGRAELDLRKLEEYCLNRLHPRGRHKARVFQEALGIGRSQAVWLKAQLLAALTEAEATALETDDYGRRWRVDIRLTRQNRQAVIRSLWLMRTGEEVPRFITCWVL